MSRPRRSYRLPPAPVPAPGPGGAKRHIVRRHTWDSVLDWCAADHPARWPHAYRSSQLGNERNGGGSFEEALSAARAGVDVPPMATIERLVDELSSRYAVAEPVYAMSGNGMLDVGRFTAGNPECVMVLIEEDRASTRTPVRIMIDVTCSWDTPPEDIRRRGQAVVGIVRALEAQGRGVEVVARTLVVNPGRTLRWECRLMLKGMSDRLDRARLGYVTGHPGYLRRIMFYLIETDPDDASAIGQNCGYPNPRESAEGFDFVLPGFFPGQWDSDARAVENVKRALAAMGAAGAEENGQ